MASRQRQDVHVLFHLLDFFLVGHAEPLFLVNNQKAEAFKLHILRKDAVSADDDVHIAFF